MEHLEDALYFLEENEDYSAIACFTALVLFNALCVPLAGLVMTSCGFFLKEVKGFIVMYTAYNLAAAIGFLIGRKLFQKRVQARVKKSVVMSAMARAVQRRGWRLVFLLQLPPTGVPSPLLNYCAGAATTLQFSEYCKGTLLGCPMHVFCYVYLGALLSSVEELLEGRMKHSSVYYVANVVGVALSLWITVYTVRITRKEMEIIRADHRKEQPFDHSTSGDDAAV